MPAPSSEPTTTPVRMSARIGSWPRTQLPTASTSATAASPPAKAKPWIATIGSAKKMREHRAERAARGDAEDVGRDERIAEQVLVGGAGGGEGRADGSAASTRGPRTCSTTASTFVASPLSPPESAAHRALRHVAGRDGEAAHRKAPGDEDDEDGEGEREDRAGERRALAR